MAYKRIAGITLEIGGDATQLNKALKGVDKQLSSTQSKLKDVNKLLKMNPGNTELLTQKQKLLTEAIKGTEDRLKTLKSAQKESLSPDQWDSLQREIIETENNLESLKKEMKDFGSVAAQKIKSAGEKMQEVGQKISSVGSSLTTKLTLPIAAAFTAAGKSASDYEENINKIDTAFGKSAKEVKKWAKTATQQYGLSLVAATEATAGFGALAKGIGLTEKQAAGVSTTLAGLSSDLSSYFNVSTDDSAKALEGIFTGEAEALKKFGVVMTETNLKKFAEDHGKVWKECSQSEKVMIRYNYVLEKTKDAQGDYSRTADGTANSFRTFQANVQNLATVLGQKLLPIITPFVQKLTAIIEKFSRLSPQTQELIVKIGLLVAAIGPILKIVGPITSLIGTVLTKVPQIVSHIKTLVSGVQGLAGVLGSGGPVILAITAAIAAGVLIYKNWDKIKAAADKLKKSLSKAWTNIKNTVSKAWDAVKKATTKAWDAVKKTVTNSANKLKDSITGGMDKVKTTMSKTWDSVKTTANSAWKTIRTTVSNGAATVKESVSNRMTQVKETMSKAWDGAKSAASKAWENIRTAVSNGAKTVVDSVSTRMKSVKETMKSAWDGVKSTVSSKLSTIANTASTTFNSVRNKISNAFKNINITNPFTKLVNAGKNAINAIKSMFRVNLKFPKITLPHFKISGKFSLKPPSVPRISVSWYKKAYDNPMLFTSPTVLQTGKGLKGFGDGKGGELVYGHAQLMKDIAKAAGNGATYTINVYGTDGMNVNQLADAVQNRLVALQRQRELACV